MFFSAAVSEICELNQNKEKEKNENGYFHLSLANNVYHIYILKLLEV